MADAVVQLTKPCSRRQFRRLQLAARKFQALTDGEPAKVLVLRAPTALRNSSSTEVLRARPQKRERASHRAKRTTAKASSESPGPRVIVRLGPVDLEACRRLARLLVDQASQEVLSQLEAKKIV